MKTLAITTFAALLALGQAHATPYLYTYTGSHYSADALFTNSASLNQPGFTLQDHVTASFTLDSSLWGQELAPFGATLSSGPYTQGQSGSILTDDSGFVLAWKIGVFDAAFKIMTRRELGGSGYDWIWTDPVHHLPFEGSTAVEYESGASNPGWTFSAVPDTGGTFSLLFLSLGFLLVGKLRFFDDQIKSSLRYCGDQIKRSSGCLALGICLLLLVSHLYQDRRQYRRTCETAGKGGKQREQKLR
jgi:hypothetical protein